MDEKYLIGMRYIDTQIAELSRKFGKKIEMETGLAPETYIAERVIDGFGDDFAKHLENAKIIFADIRAKFA
jgi:hypothetical protein